MTQFVEHSHRFFFYMYDCFVYVFPSIITSNLLTEFHLNAGSLGFLISLFSFTSILFQIPAGVLLDRFGAKTIISGSMLVSAVGVILFSVASHAYYIGLARLLMGVSSPFAFLGALYLASCWMPHQYFAFWSGFVQFIGVVGSIAGLSIAAALINHFGWREISAFMGALIAIISITFWAILQDDKTNTAITQNNNFDIKKVLLLTDVWWIGLLGFTSWTVVTGVGSLWGVPYLMTVYKFSDTTVSIMLSFFWLSLGVGSAVIGWCSDHVKSRKKPVYFCFILGLLGVSIFINAADFPPWLLTLALGLMGASASIQSLTFALAKDIIPPQYFMLASAIINMMAVVSGIIAQPLIGLLINSHAIIKTSHVVAYTSQDYRLGFVVLPLVIVIGLIVTRLKIKETRCVSELLMDPPL